MRSFYFLINSTLLFFALPSSVELSAIGLSSPSPAELNLEDSMPPFTIKSTTDLSRASESYRDVISELNSRMALKFSPSGVVEFFLSI